MKRCLFALWAALALLLTGAARAEAYPAGPVRAVVGYDAGGPLDVVARIVAQDLSRTLGQPVVVENRPGASGLIATEQVARAKPDGATLLFVPSTFVVNPMLIDKANYRPLQDFAMISRLSTTANVLVTAADAKFGSVRELIEAARAAPESISYASSGIGGPAHLSGELLQAQTGVKMVHVPYKGSAPALTEVIAGRITFMFYPVTGLREHIAAGRLKALAVAGVAQRLETFASVPTMAEAGYPGFEDAGIWFGLVAPAGTPKTVVDRLNDAVRVALQRGDTRERLAGVGALPIASTPEQFAEFVRDDAARWERLIRSAGIRLTKE